ncbi:MAG: HD domain-containing protein, partial [Bacteroidota bacterium]
LRRIKQLGLTSLVYPGGIHTRFHHALGAMHLTRLALDVLRSKQVDISPEEYEATLIAILLHDVGHGPFSHSLEYVIIPNLHHEDMSLALMQYLNEEYEGKLDLAIRIFTGDYPRAFFHQLVSSQLDMDRMDYLIRDSFFTGVAEGVVGLDRIIKTLNVRNDQIVVESKGIYSVEKFIVARRLMYWQVYLHKAALAADFMLVNILRRARWLFEQGVSLGIDENLLYFFASSISAKALTEEVIQRYVLLDDYDIEYAIKKWQAHPDPVLSDLCQRLLFRRLLKVKLKNSQFDKEKERKYLKKAIAQLGISREVADYYVFTGTVSNQAYLKGSKEPILIRFKNGKVKDLSKASDIDNINALAEPVVKHYLCHPAIL